VLSSKLNPERSNNTPRTARFAQRRWNHPGADLVLSRPERILRVSAVLPPRGRWCSSESEREHADRTASEQDATQHCRLSPRRWVDSVARARWRS